MTPELTLQTSHPWLLAQFKRVDENLRELTQIITDPEAEGEARERALIASAELLCNVIRSCREKELFEAAAQDFNGLGQPMIQILQREIREHLKAILDREEAILVAAELDPRAARTLREDIQRMGQTRYHDATLFNIQLDHYAHLAIDDICHKFPKSPIDFKINGFKNALAKVRGKYGVVGGLLVCTANAVALINIPEVVTITKFSKLIGVAYTAHSAMSGV